MDELYQDLKMMDYIIICLTNKYRLVHSYIQGVADIFAVTIDEYHKLIQKIISLYKESLYNSVHANLSQLKEDVERQRAHDKNLMEIKENLKRAIKLTKTGEICTTVEAPEKRQIQMDTTLKIDPPYDTTALYKFRHYRNTFVKRYSTITKNENYLNANEQRKRFLRKLRSSAKVTKERNDRADGIFKDEQKNMIRIVSENHIFQESHKLKEVLIVNKFLNKAKSIVNDVPQFLWKIIEEFERTESVAQENMYLFVLLALNKWLKKIVTECERFISLNRTKGYRKKTDSVEIHKKMSDYMNDILQRGAEQTMMFSEEKALFQYPPHINFNESSLYMSSDMYSYQFRNEHEEDYEKVHQYHRQHGEHKQQQHHKERKTEQSHHILHLSNLMYRINQEDMYPNIFLICNYLLLGETKKIIELVYQMQRNSFDLLLCYDASVIIQLIICLFSNLKRLFAWGTCHAQPSTTTTTPPHMAEEEEPYYDDLRKCISETKINYLSPNSYVKCLGHIRLMLLNVLKTLHTMTKEGDRNYVCTFWEKTHIPMGGENQPREDSYTHERDQLIPIKNGCIKNNCYFFHEKKRTDVSMDGLTQQTEEHTNRIIQRRILCYDFYKFVIDHVKTVKLLMENRSNREEYTGILIKRNNRYNIDGGVSGSTRSGGGARGKKSTPLRGRPSAVRKVSKTAGPYAGVSSAPIHLNPTGGKIFIEIANKTDSKGKVGQRDPPKAAPPKKGIQSSVNPSVSTTTTPTQIAKKQVVKIRRGLSSTRHSSQDIRNKTNPPPKWVSNAGKTSAPSMKQ